jgi:uncharacterized membrane protein YgcG
MLAWGLAKLQHDVSCVVWPQLVAAAQQQLAGFKPQELTMLMWALASLQQRQQQRWRSGVPAEAGAGKSSSSSSYTAQWLAESAEQQQQQGEQRAAQAFRTRLQYSASTSSSSSGTGSNSRAASAVGSSSSRLSSASGRQQDSLQQRLQQFWPAVCDTISLQLQQGAQRYKAQELSSLLWSCAVLNCRDAQLLQQLANQLQQQLLQGRCNSQDVSNSLWALGKLQLQHPLLLAAAVDTAGSWMKQCSNSELSLVLYGCAATSREAAGSQAAAQLWLLCTDEVQQRLLTAADGWGLAECTTLLQAVAFVLQSPARVRSRQRQQQAQQRQQLQRQAQQNSNSSSVAPAAPPQQQQQQQSAAMQEQSLQHAGTTAPSSNGSSSSSSMCSMSSATGSWDADDAGMADAAHELAAAVDAHLSRTQLISPSSSSIRLYLPCILSSFAVAQLQPSQQLRHALLTTASRITAGLNRQQLCMTAWAAAKLAPQPGAAADEETWQLMDVLESAALSKLPAMQPQQLSVLAWAHARLWNLGDSLLLHELARSAARALPRFGPQALSNLAWAFARARHYDGAFTAGLGRRARPLLGQFSAAELSNLAWGLLTLRCRQSVLLTALGKYTTQHCSCSSWDAKACTKIAYAYASGGMPLHRFKGMFRALGDAVLAKPGGLAGLNVHELSQLAQAFAVARVRHKALVGHIASAAVQRLPSMALVDVVQLVWALACLNHRHDQLLTAVSARVAAEMGSQQQQQQQPDSSSHDDPADNSSSSFVGPASQLDAAAAGWDRSSSSSMFQGKLRPQYLPKLAWAYKTLQHEDAGWYMAAAVLAAELTGEDGSSSSSSGDGSSSGYYGSSNSSSFAGSSSSGGVSSSSWSGVGPRAVPAGGVGVLRVPQNGNSRHVNNSHGISSPGRSSSSSSSKGGSSIPTLLQRPVYQQPGVEGAAAVQQQQQL